MKDIKKYCSWNLSLSSMEGHLCFIFIGTFIKVQIFSIILDGDLIVACHNSINSMLSLIYTWYRESYTIGKFYSLPWQLRAKNSWWVWYILGHIHKHLYLCSWIISVNYLSNCSCFSGLNWFSITPFFSKIAEETLCALC